MTHAFGEDEYGDGDPHETVTQAVGGADHMSDALAAVLLVALSPLSAIVGQAWANLLRAVDEVLSTHLADHERVLLLQWYVGPILFAGLGTWLARRAWRGGTGWTASLGRAAAIVGVLVLAVCAVGVLGLLIGGYSTGSGF